MRQFRGIGPFEVLVQAPIRIRRGPQRTWRCCRNCTSERYHLGTGRCPRCGAGLLRKQER